MAGMRARTRAILLERERKEAAVREAIKRPARGLARLASLWLHCLSRLEGSAYLFQPPL